MTGGSKVGGKGPKSSKAVVDEWSNESNGYLGRFFSVFQSFLMKFIKSPNRQNSLAEAVKSDHEGTLCRT